MNKQYDKTRSIYYKMLEAAKVGNDAYAYECALEIWNCWYFKLFNEESRSWVEHVLVNYNPNSVDKLA